MTGPAAGPALGQPAGPAAGSRLLATVAERRGLAVHRLSGDLVLCDDGRHRAMFLGLAGVRAARIAELLCGHAGWLRAHLARHGLPVLATRPVDPRDPEAARRSAEELGFPIRLRWPAARAGEWLAADREAFLDRWRAAGTAPPDDRTPLLLERVPEGGAMTLAVVAGRVVATAAGAGGAPAAGWDQAAAGELAVRAVAAVPGAADAAVRLVTGAEPAPRVVGAAPRAGAEPRTDSAPIPGGLVVDTVDPAFECFAGDPVAGRSVAEAVLAAAFPAPR